jgi:hypothetical protein
VLSGRERALEARDRRSLGSHALGDLRLGEPGLFARLEQRVEQGEFLALKALYFGAHARPAHQLFYDLVMSFHV